MRIAIGYIRISRLTASNAETSLPSQRARLLAWAEANGYTLLHIHEDAGISGKSLLNRPGAQAAITAACRNRCPLVAVSLSRIVRSVTDAITVGDRLSRSGADIISLSENIDTTTASGRLVYRLLSLLGEFERDLISERTTAVLSHLRSTGKRISGAIPYGVTLSSDGQTLVPNPAEMAVIDRLHQRRAEGASYRILAEELERDGVLTKGGKTTWMPKVVRAILLRDRELRAVSAA